MIEAFAELLGAVAKIVALSSGTLYRIADVDTPVYVQLLGSERTIEFVEEDEEDDDSEPEVRHRIGF